MVLIDATDLILGRIAAYAAKQALLGEKVDVVNCEKAVVTGARAYLLERYRHKIRRGAPRFGPHFPRNAERIMRRTIRGMLPHKKERGREIFRRVMCYMGVPPGMGFENQKAAQIQRAHVSKIPTTKYMRLGEIASLVGSKQ